MNTINPLKYILHGVSWETRRDISLNPSLEYLAVGASIHTHVYDRILGVTVHTSPQVQSLGALSQTFKQQSRYYITSKYPNLRFA